MLAYDIDLARGHEQPRCLEAGTVVEIVRHGSEHATVQVDVEGFLVTGDVSTAALPARPGVAAGGLVGCSADHLQGGFGFQAPCDGAAVLPATAPVWTAPAGDADARALRSRPRDLRVTFLSCLPDDVRIRIDHPHPEVDSLVGWVRRADLRDR